MRYENAEHVDYSGLYERRSQVGLPLAVIGCLLIPISICGREFIDVHYLLLLTCALWFVAWYSIIGVFYRLPLSFAFLTQLVLITLLQLGLL